jgi:hypothetical protein
VRRNSVVAVIARHACSEAKRKAILAFKRYPFQARRRKTKRLCCIYSLFILFVFRGRVGEGQAFVEAINRYGASKERMACREIVLHKQAEYHPPLATL